MLFTSNQEHHENYLQHNAWDCMFAQFHYTKLHLNPHHLNSYQPKKKSHLSEHTGMLWFCSDAGSTGPSAGSVSFLQWKCERPVGGSSTSLVQRRLLPRIFCFCFNKHALLWVVGGGGFLDNWDLVSQEIFPELSTLTYEAERTLDLPRRRSVQRGRGGDWCNQRRS